MAVSDSSQANWGILRNAAAGQQAGQPLTMADIERILKSANAEVPRLDAVVTPQPGDERPDPAAVGSGLKPQRKQMVVLRLDGPNGILTFECELEIARLLVDLRQKWNSLLLRRLRNPGKPCHQQDEVRRF